MLKGDRATPSLILFSRVQRSWNCKIFYADANARITQNRGFDGRTMWKSRKGYAPSRLLQSIFSSNLGKNSVLGFQYPCRCTDWGEICHGGGASDPLLRAKFQPHRCNVSPLRGEKPQKRPGTLRCAPFFELKTSTSKRRQGNCHRVCG